MEDNIIEGKEDNRETGLRGFDYILFLEKEDGGVRKGIDGYPYLKHLIKFFFRVLGGAVGDDE